MLAKLRSQLRNDQLECGYRSPELPSLRLTCLDRYQEHQVTLHNADQPLFVQTTSHRGTVQSSVQPPAARAWISAVADTELPGRSSNELNGDLQQKKRLSIPMWLRARLEEGAAHTARKAVQIHSLRLNCARKHANKTRKQVRSTRQRAFNQQP